MKSACVDHGFEVLNERLEGKLWNVTIGETDAALHLFRLALFCEDRVAEMLAALSHAAGIAGAAVKELWPIWPSRVRREPLWFGAQRWPLGSMPGGFVPDNERWAHEESVPEFEIVSCADEHLVEVTMVFAVEVASGEATFPTRADLDAFAAEYCDPAAAEYLQAELNQTVEAGAIPPSPDEWSAGERWIACTIGSFMSAAMA